MTLPEDRFQDPEYDPGPLKIYQSIEGSTTVRALHSYFAADTEQVTYLSFQSGQTIKLLSKDESGWWDGICNGKRGWFPSTYVQEAEEEGKMNVHDVENATLPQLENHSTSRRKHMRVATGLPVSPLRATTSDAGLAFRLTLARTALLEERRRPDLFWTSPPPMPKYPTRSNPDWVNSGLKRKAASSLGRCSSTSNNHAPKHLGSLLQGSSHQYWRVLKDRIFNAFTNLNAVQLDDNAEIAFILSEITEAVNAVLSIPSGNSLSAEILHKRRSRVEEALNAFLSRCKSVFKSAGSMPTYSIRHAGEVDEVVSMERRLVIKVEQFIQAAQYFTCLSPNASKPSSPEQMADAVVTVSSRPQNLSDTLMYLNENMEAWKEIGEDCMQWETKPVSKTNIFFQPLHKFTGFTHQELDALDELQETVTESLSIFFDLLRDSDPPPFEEASVCVIDISNSLTAFLQLIIDLLGKAAQCHLQTSDHTLAISDIREIWKEIYFTHLETIELVRSSAVAADDAEKGPIYSNVLEQYRQVKDKILICQQVCRRLMNRQDRDPIAHSGRDLPTHLASETSRSMMALPKRSSFLATKEQEMTMMFDLEAEMGSGDEFDDHMEVLQSKASETIRLGTMKKTDPKEGQNEKHTSAGSSVAKTSPLSASYYLPPAVTTPRPKRSSSLSQGATPAIAGEGKPAAAANMRDPSPEDKPSRPEARSATAALAEFLFNTGPEDFVGRTASVDDFPAIPERKSSSGVLNKSRLSRMKSVKMHQRSNPELRVRTADTLTGITRSKADKSTPLMPQSPDKDATSSKAAMAVKVLGMATPTTQDMVFNAEGQVMGAKVEDLVVRLTLHDKSPDPEFSNAFLLNFRLFIQPIDFVALLYDRFNISPPEGIAEDEAELAVWKDLVQTPVQLRVYNVLKNWLENYFDYQQDYFAEEYITSFVAGPLSQYLPAPAKRLLGLVKRKFASRTSMSSPRQRLLQEAAGTNEELPMSIDSAAKASRLSRIESLPPPNSVSPPPLVAKLTLSAMKASTTLLSFNIMELDPIELARQLTLMECAAFCSIRPNELIGQHFNKQEHGLAPGIRAAGNLNTKIASWMTTLVLSYEDPKHRAALLKYFIRVGEVCLQLHNFNTLMAVRSALDSSSISRLKRTWEQLGQKSKQGFDGMLKATDSSRNFGDYRNSLKQLVAPCLPFLGLYLTDLIFIDEGNPDTRMAPNGQELVNFDKYVKTARIISDIQRFQIPYPLRNVPAIQNYLFDVFEHVETDPANLYNKSIQIEPREEEK